MLSRQDSGPAERICAAAAEAVSTSAQKCQREAWAKAHPLICSESVAKLLLLQRPVAFVSQLSRTGREDLVFIGHPYLLRSCFPDSLRRAFPFRGSAPTAEVDSRVTRL